MTADELIAMALIGHGLDTYTGMPTWVCYLIGVPLGVPGGFFALLFVDFAFGMITSALDPDDGLLANAWELVKCAAFIAPCIWLLHAWTPLPLWACIIIGMPIGLALSSIFTMFRMLFEVRCDIRELDLDDE